MMVVVALLAVGALARVGFVVATPGYTPQIDSKDYVRLSRAIARTGDYPTSQVWVTRRGCPRVSGLPRTPCVARRGARGAYVVARATAYRPPGYPYALAVPELLTRWFGGRDLSLARLFQTLLGVLVVGLVGLLGWMLWGPRVGLIVLGLAAIYLPLVLMSGVLMSEPLYTALMLAAICAVLRWRSHGGRLMVTVAGVLAGLAALTRDNGVIVLVGVAALAASGRGSRGSMARVRPPLLVIAVAVLTVAPWTIRNAVVMDGFLPISDETGPTLIGTYNPVSMANRTQPGLRAGVADLTMYREFFREAPAHSELTIDSALTHDSITFALDHPAYIATVFWHNTLRLLDLHGLARIRFGAKTLGLPPGVTIAGAIMFYLVALLALVGVFVPATRRAPRALWIIPGLQFVTTVLVIVETPRFRTPLEPFVLLLAALTLDRLGALAKGRIRHRRLASALGESYSA